MKTTVAIRMLGLMLILLLPGTTARAAQSGDGEADPVPSQIAQGRYFPSMYRTYAEFALELMLRPDHNRFLAGQIDPDEYIVGPGDEFGIYFMSGDVDDVEARINPDGDMFVTSVGRVSVGRLSLREALEKIRRAIRVKYTGTEFDVQISDFRFVRVNVIGEVSRPGLYYVPAAWRVSEAIDLAGGITSDASPRTIILQGDDITVPVDLLRFNTLSDQSVNPLVCLGHTIQVPNRRSIGAFVTVSGLVNRPGTFAAKSRDRLADYIAYALGAAGQPADMEMVISSRDGSMTRLDGATSTTPDYMPGPGDNIVLVWKEGRHHFGEVSIFGEVTRPGRYPIPSEEFTLADLLAFCGGPTVQAYPEMIQVFRLVTARSEGPDDIGSDVTRPLPNGGKQSVGPAYRRQYHRLSLNPRDPVAFSRIALADGDSLFLPGATGMVLVTGAVVSPGLVPFQKGRSVEYYLEQAGGPGYDADRDRMVVVNPMTGGRIPVSAAGILFDGETLYVPRKENSSKP